MTLEERETLQEQIAQINQRLDDLVGEKIYREAEEIRQKNRDELEANRAVLEQEARWFKQTDDGWVNVKRDGDSKSQSLPSHLKVSLRSTSAGRDNITVLEGIFIGLKASLTTGFLVATDPHHGLVTTVFSKRVGGPITIGGEVFDKQIVLTFMENGVKKEVGPHTARTDPTNPVPDGTHIIQIPDFPHDKGLPYGPRGTVWFRIGDSGDRYIHPGLLSDGCVTCAQAGWPEIYPALAKGQKDSTAVGDVNVRP